MFRAPCFSDDGRFLAFEREKGMGKLGNLQVIASDGGAESPLATANWKGEGAYPSFLPSSQEGDYWLLFAQNRAPDDVKLNPDQLQLWAVSLICSEDAALVTNGEPFWLPLQSAEQSNWRPLFDAR